MIEGLEANKRQFTDVEAAAAGEVMRQQALGPNFSDAWVAAAGEAMRSMETLENVNAMANEAARAAEVTDQFKTDPAVAGWARALDKINSVPIVQTMEAVDFFTEAAAFADLGLMKTVESEEAPSNVLKGLEPLIEPLADHAVAGGTETTPGKTPPVGSNRNLSSADVSEFQAGGEVGESTETLPLPADWPTQFYDNMAGLSTRQKTLGAFILGYAIVLYVHFPAVMAGVSDPQNAEISPEQATQVVFWAGVIHRLLWGAVFTDD